MTYLYAPPNVHVTGRRIVATILDGFVLGALSSALTSAFGAGWVPSGFNLTTLSFHGSLYLTVVVLLYYTLLEGVTGRTVGKFVTGIRVIDAKTGQTPGMFTVFLRTVLRVIDGIGGYLLGWIVVLLNSRRRRLGDIAADTLVIRAR